MPLTPEQIAIVKLSAPALEPVAEQIIKNFYSAMLGDNPELLEIFSKTSQLTLAQPRALAMSVVAYAKNIDNLGVLGDAVNRIAQKHCAYLIRPDQYEIVGEYLLGAFADHFGPEVAHEAFLLAWAAAYQQLADILIAAEKAIYEENAKKGWRQFKKFKLIRKVKETHNVYSYYLQPSDDKIVVPAAGQFIGFRFTLPDGTVQHRQYSVSDIPEESSYRVSVKRIPGGLVSEYMHDYAQEGDELDILVPGGDFVLRDTNSDILLIGAGIGITPLVSISKTAICQGRKVDLIQCDRDEATAPFKETFNQLVAKNPDKFGYQRFYSDDRLFNKDDLETAVKRLDKPEVYVVGPPKFMNDIHTWLGELDVAKDAQAYFDFFGPTRF